MLRLTSTITAGVLGTALLLGSGCETTGSTSKDRPTLAALGESAPADKAMAELKAGNKRFVSGNVKHPRSGSARISQTSGSQKPFVSVLSCADSRVPVERVFDQGIGDVFVVRMAGNVAGVNETGSLEFGVGALGTNLVVVMGHTKCGAVDAVVNNAQVSGSLPALVAPIGPAVSEARAAAPGAPASEVTELAVRYNVMQSISDLLNRSDALSAAVRSGNVKIVGAVYDLDTGKVEWLGEHPRQAQLVMASN